MPRNTVLQGIFNGKQFASAGDGFGGGKKFVGIRPAKHFLFPRKQMKK
jgi:hypothetical protein